jgi:hypothetical protein
MVLRDLKDNKVRKVPQDLMEPLVSQGHQDPREQRVR